MCAAEAGAEVVGDFAGADFAKVGMAPARLAVLVDQQGAHAFGEVGLAGAGDRHDVFDLEHVSQLHVTGALPQCPRQAGGAGGAVGEGVAGGGQPAVFIVGEGAQAVGDVDQAVVADERLDAVEMGAQA